MPVDISQSYVVAKNNNPNYNVHIKCAGLGVEIIADMPETTTYAVAGDYENLFPDSSGLLSSSASNTLTYSSGASASLQYLTQLVWKNNSPIDIPLTILFDATKSAYDEVYKPMRVLETLAMPTVSGGFFFAPNYGENSMFLSIGRMFTMSKMLLVSVSNTFDSRLTKDGYPIAGQSDVVFRTPKTMSRDEWQQAIGISA